ncbi:MAG: hypothetical protein ACWGPN_10805 [Gammaproteobacteria bacterium]
MVRWAIRTVVSASALAGAAVWGQTPSPEVRNIEIEVEEFAIASAEVRLTAVVWNLDKDHDQYLTEDEVVAALNRLQQSVNNARLRHYLEGRQVSLPGIAGSGVRGGTSLRGRTLERLAAAQSMIATTAPELSLVDEEFHELFADLPAEQRAVLLEADVQGNNDGTVTVREFHSHTRKLLRKTTQFEEDFGEEAYLTVLRRLGEL